LRELIKYRVVLTLALTFLVLFGWTALVCLPSSSHIRETKTAVASLDQEIANSRQYLTNAAVNLQSKRWQRQRADMLTGLCRIDSLASFVDHLTADINRFGVNNLDVTPDLNQLLKRDRIAIGNVNLTTAKFTLRCEGGFVNVGRALEYVEGQPYFADLATANFDYADATAPAIVAEMVFSVYLRDGE
jgi:hypothetical protein